MNHACRTVFAIALATHAVAGPQEARKMKIATGTFSVTMLPSATGPAPTGEFVRLSLTKQFQGPLAGASRVEMMATSDGTNPSGGYVALERFTGTLDGKQGSFVMQHSGVMSPGRVEIHVVISPGTGTEELAGLDGTLEIKREGKQHFYTLRYTLPERKNPGAEAPGAK